MQKTILGKSKTTTDLRVLIQKVAGHNVTVLVTGESGTGKELIARQIHAQSDRKNNPFVAVNCAAIPTELIEAELFGAEKGAYTGISERRKGLFREANGGTIFLDEVGELPAPAQTKLLRVLQERTVRAVGGESETKLDVRVVSATNRDLFQEVGCGRFREDLYYRLNVINIESPALRERSDDLPELVDHYTRSVASEEGMTPIRFTSVAMMYLQTYDWPGNVRELINMIHKLTVVSHGRLIRLEDLPKNMKQSELKTNWAFDRTLVRKLGEGVPLDNLVATFESNLVEQAMFKANGNPHRAATLLGVPRTKLDEILGREKKAA